jgi:hypothetical protein
MQACRCNKQFINWKGFFSKLCWPHLAM